METDEVRALSHALAGLAGALNGVFHRVQQKGLFLCLEGLELVNAQADARNELGIGHSAKAVLRPFTRDKPEISTGHQL